MTVLAFGCHARFEFVRSDRVCDRNSVETVVIDKPVGSTCWFLYSYPDRITSKIRGWPVDKGLKQ